MKAVILPAEKPELLSPIYNWAPDFLLPVVNKPVAEILIELLLENNIRDIIFILNHQPYETEKYFEMGERWGCNISYALIREYEGIIPSLSRIKNRLHGAFLCLPANIVTNIDIASFVNFHNKESVDMTVPESISPRHFEHVRKSYPFIMNHGSLSLLSETGQNPDLPQMIGIISGSGLKVSTYRSTFDYCKIDSLNDYVDVNRAILTGKIKGINIPGKEISKGVWVGRNSFINPSAEITPPVLIGANCSIRKSVELGEYTIIGDDVIVDTDAHIKRSIIYEKTYIGTNTEINDSIVRKNFIFNMPCMSKLYVSDDSILGNMDKRMFSEKFCAVYNFITGLVMLFFFSPLILMLFLYNKLFPSKKYLHIEKRYGGYSSTNMTGDPELSVIRQYYFNSNSSLIRKLPGLINVIKGDINLVGNSTLSRNEVNSLTEEWQKIRFEAPTGLIHLWETDKNLTISWEEKIISESYYASTRSFTGDIMILLKFLFQRKDRKVKDDHSEPVSA